MADWSVAGCRRAVGAGTSGPGALPDLSRYRRRLARLYAFEPFLDAGAGTGAGAVRCPGPDGDPSEEAEILRLEYRAVLLSAECDPNGGVTSGELPADPLRRRALAAARRALLSLRRSEEIGDDAFHQLEEELDRAELSAQA